MAVGSVVAVRVVTSTVPEAAPAGATTFTNRTALSPGANPATPPLKNVRLVTTGSVPSKIPLVLLSQYSVVVHPAWLLDKASNVLPTPAALLPSNTVPLLVIVWL